MARSIRIRVPEIHGRATGGNVVNRRLIAALRRREDVRVFFEHPDEAHAHREEDAAEAGSGDGDLTLVDSLRLGDPAPGRNVLIAHYLHCVDPDAQDSEAAERERSRLGAYDAIIAPSRWVRDRLRAIGVPADRVFAWRPGLDERFRSARSESASGSPSAGSGAPAGTCSRGEEVPTILTVASLIPGKGHDLIPAVAGAIADRAWRWILVGEELRPRWAEKMRDRFEESDLADRFEWRGVLEPAEMPALYEEADLFVLPSRFETLGLAVREAMALGCPPVAFRTGGIPESITHGETGMLAGKPGSADRLAEAVESLLADTERRERIGRAARAASRDFPDWDASAEELLNILDRVSDLPPKQSA